jgi:hypothetical protein
MSRVSANEGRASPAHRTAEKGRNRIIFILKAIEFPEFKYSIAAVCEKLLEPAPGQLTAMVSARTGVSIASIRAVVVDL